MRRDAQFKAMEEGLQSDEKNHCDRAQQTAAGDF